MQLSHEQKRQIWEDGYTIIPGAISRVQVDAALRAINHAIGEGMPPEQMTKFRSQTYCPELHGTPVITDLFDATPLRALMESAVGVGMLMPTGAGQIALRFPILQDPPPSPIAHIDGVYTPTNGVTKGSISNFTALAAVFLSDLPHEGMGNFTVWPGTHRANEAYFREHGTDILLTQRPPVELPPARQLCVQAGDAVICHYALLHGLGPNSSPHIRYAVFFRLKHRDHDGHRLETLSDIWLDWHGMQAFRG